MFFSIVAPVYNVEKYLKNCVDSVLSQTFQDFELILVDDGSKDNSGIICDEYASKDNRVKVFHKENGGQSSARNLGIEKAQGEFAVFIDSDDFFSDVCFLESVKNSICDNTDIVLFRYSKYYEDGHTNDCNINMSDIEYDNKTTLLKQLVKRDSFFCSCWSKCTRMSILKNNNIVFDTSLSCEDMDWYYNVVLNSSEFKVIDKSFVNYRQRENSVTSTFKVKSVVDYIYTIEKWSGTFNSIEDNEEKYVMLSSLAKLYCNLLISYSRHTKELKAHKKKIFSFKWLLSYDLNPRTKMISKVTRLAGLNVACALLKIYEKVR